jgi:uncharacterized protein with HEPN domain
MSSIRTEKLFLNDIVEAADAIQLFISDVERDRFMLDDRTRSAVLYKMTIIGEAAGRVSREFRARYPAVEWSDIIGLRNIAVHAYFGVDWHTIWVTATNDVPLLRKQIADILAREYP